MFDGFFKFKWDFVGVRIVVSAYSRCHCALNRWMPVDGVSRLWASVSRVSRDDHYLLLQLRIYRTCLRLFSHSQIT